MLKKTLAVLLLAVMMVMATQAVYAGSTRAKRLVAQLYERREATDAERQLSNYGPEVAEYAAVVLDDDTNDRVRLAALRIIASVNGTTVEEDVIAVLNDKNNRIRQQAAKTLSVIGTTDAGIEPLKGLLNDPYPNVRFNAINALATLAPEKEVNVFIDALNDHDARIRKSAVIALGKIKNPKAVPALSKLVRDPDAGVRYELTKALANIGTPDCVEPMALLMGDPDRKIRLLAVDEIGKIKTSAADDSLVLAADSSDSKIASKAIISLGERKSSKALAVARKHLSNEYMVVKLACIEVVGKMGNRSDKALLEPLLEAESSSVRMQARRAMQELDSKT